MYKALYITDSLRNGGSERQLDLLVKSLPKDWERRVWSLGAGLFADIIRSDGFQVNINERSWRWDISPALRLWKLIKKWKPQIIHSFGYMSTLAALPATRLFHIPFVDGSIRQANVPKYRGRLMKWSLKWADRVIANSQAGLKAFSIKTDRGRVIYNGFDLSRLEKNNQVQKKDENPFTVIMVGRMHPMKDYVTYIDAARLLVEKDIEWKFLALGNGPLRESLILNASDLINKGVLIFPEPTLEVLPYDAGCDVGVLLTNKNVHEEGFSNAIMEYMACGLPVICNDSGGNRELVIDGQTGFIVESANFSIVVEKLLWLRNNRDIARRMGLAGQERIFSDFSIKNMVEKTVSVYHELLST